MIKEMIGYVLFLLKHFMHEDSRDRRTGELHALGREMQS